ncbi:MAG: hypothetical protein HYZ50_23885 [Deltaproteobacteria bacterium]|nr:hypothetical protein [Deltaproteobacteria bacterium]
MAVIVDLHDEFAKLRVEMHDLRASLITVDVYFLAWPGWRDRRSSLRFFAQVDAREHRSRLCYPS